MPKDKTSGTSALRVSRSRPYKPRGKGCEAEGVDESDGRKDWEDVVCSICLEAPHNAVLLVCSSHAQGCRPYMCNTSHRHSNCLDQYQKTQVALQKSQSPRPSHLSAEEHPEELVVDSHRAEEVLNLRIVDAHLAQAIRRASRPSTSHDLDDSNLEVALIEALNSRVTNVDPAMATRRSRRTMQVLVPSQHESEPAGTHMSDMEIGSDGEGLEGYTVEGHSTGSLSLKSKHLVCPLCRGQISGWRVINAARKYFNDKARNCSQELCTFAGTYQELRVHARCEHPFSRPCDVDRARQRDWQRMERQREIGDVLSSINGVNEDMENDDGHWWSYFFLFHFFGPTPSTANEERIISRIREHRQVQPQRGVSARLRGLVENVQADGTSSAGENRDAGAIEHMTNLSQRRRLRSQRRQREDMD